MPRRNYLLRFDKAGPGPRQKGKGRKRMRDYHHSTAAMAKHLLLPPLPDVGSGADPTAAAPVKVLSRGAVRNRGEALA
jgi:hypothetical protein